VFSSVLQPFPALPGILLAADAAFEE
jgi:hypothetical protein